MSAVAHIHPSAQAPLFKIGGTPHRLTIKPGELVDIDSEDAFSGRLISTDGKPREVAPFPLVNPLTGPVYVEGARPGDVLAVHIASIEPLRPWGAATLSPNFGLLSGTPDAPNLQPPLDERVWIWTLDEQRTTLSTTGEPRLRVPYRPFLGTLAVAPANGEVRTSVVPGPFGGNLDISAVEPDATVYLCVNEPGGLLVVGDGHLAQGDGEFAGTAVEGAVRTRMVFDVLPDDQVSSWPRIEAQHEYIAVGCGKPLENAYAVAAHQLTLWISQLSGLPAADAFQLISQAASARVGNLVNPQYTATVAIAKRLVPRRDPGLSAHDRLSQAVGQTRLAHLTDKEFQ